MTSKAIQGYCRCCHLIAICNFLLVFLCNSISVLHRFRDINTYLPKKLRRHVTLTTPTWDSLSSHDYHFSGQPVQKNWRIYLQPFQRNLRGCKILKRITWPRPPPFRDDRPSEGQHLTQPASTQNLTTLASAVAEIFHWVWNSRMRRAALTTPIHTPGYELA